MEEGGLENGVEVSVADPDPLDRIHMFLGPPNPDPLVRGMHPAPDPDPNPSIIMQK